MSRGWGFGKTRSVQRLYKHEEACYFVVRIVFLTLKLIVFQVAGHLARGRTRSPQHQTQNKQVCPPVFRGREGALRVNPPLHVILELSFYFNDA